MPKVAEWTPPTALNVLCCGGLMALDFITIRGISWENAGGLSLFNSLFYFSGYLLVFLSCHNYFSQSSLHMLGEPRVISTIVTWLFVTPGVSLQCNPISIQHSFSLWWLS